MKSLILALASLAVLVALWPSRMRSSPRPSWSSSRRSRTPGRTSSSTTTRPSSSSPSSATAPAATARRSSPGPSSSSTCCSRSSSLSVGDLIEGGTARSRRSSRREWKEFDGYVKQLQMPFFYVPGNHDIGNTDDATRSGRSKFGRRYYHFVYRDVLFLCLNTDDPPGIEHGRIGAEQVAYAKKALAENPDVRWTLVVAAQADLDGGRPGEERLARGREGAGRPATTPSSAATSTATRSSSARGMNYYQLATTGGGSRLRGVQLRRVRPHRLGDDEEGRPGARQRAARRHLPRGPEAARE